MFFLDVPTRRTRNPNNEPGEIERVVLSTADDEILPATDDDTETTASPIGEFEHQSLKYSKVSFILILQVGLRCLLFMHFFVAACTGATRTSRIT